MSFGPLLPIPRKSKGPNLPAWNVLSPEELADKMRQNNGNNVGVRLDRYVSLDPDSLAARNLCEQWEAEGKLPPTVAWRTASGAIRRLFLAPEGLVRMQIQDLKFDLRHGRDFQDVIPPSYVEDADKGIKGFYEWLPDQDPESIEPAPLPDFVVEFFKKHSSSCTILNAFSKDKISKNGARTINLDHGGRDEELFHIALTLFKGGMQYADVEYIIENLARQCTPPFSETDARKKVESAFKRQEQKDGKTITAQVREWVSVTSVTSEAVSVTSCDRNHGIVTSCDIGEFSTTFCYSELGITTAADKAVVRKALERLVEEGLIIRIAGRKGVYRAVVKEMARIKLKDANKQGVELDLRWPFQLENWYKTFPKTINMVAGVTDAGKTAFLLDFVNKNLGRSEIPPIHYFTSEMGADEFYDRASNIPGFNAEYWDKHLTIWERSSVFEDVLIPDGINIIDNLDMHDDFYKVAGIIHRIWEKLTRGIAIIALHKDATKEWGKGGQGSAERARLYLSLEPGNPHKDLPNMMKVLKIKNWRNRLTNIKGKEFKYKLINGCTIKEVEY